MTKTLTLVADDDTNGSPFETVDKYQRRIQMLSFPLVLHAATYSTVLHKGKHDMAIVLPTKMHHMLTFIPDMLR